MLQSFDVESSVLDLSTDSRHGTRGAVACIVCQGEHGRGATEGLLRMMGDLRFMRVNGAFLS